jgi:hypothetical protein
MSILYGVHIATEAHSRKSLDMGIYTLVFQVNVVVIAVADIMSYRRLPSWQEVGGGILILGGSTAVIFAQRVNKTVAARRGRAQRRAQQHLEAQRVAVRLGLLSALACGGALYIDGEVGRNYILSSGIALSTVSPFLTYEMLTFAIPALWIFFVSWFRLRISLTSIISNIWEEFVQGSLSYSLAALFSAGQFVFSVLALSLPGSRFVVAVILGASPALAVWLDKNERSRQLKSAEYIMAFVEAIGFLLLTAK